MSAHAKHLEQKFAEAPILTGFVEDMLHDPLFPGMHGACPVVV